MRPEFDTQRKVEAYFAGKTDDDSIWIRDGLYALISDVLFVPDRNNPHEYHPRIGVQHDYIYRALNDWERLPFNRLYDLVLLSPPQRLLGTASHEETAATDTVHAHAGMR